MTARTLPARPRTGRSFRRAIRTALVTMSLAACATATALAPREASAQVLPHAPVVDRLPNGLTVVTLPFEAPGIVAYFTLVRTGARDEVERGHSGYAHLFEHMMFRGTERMDATAYEHRMQELGADNNAFTTEDFTLYTVTLPSASLASLVPIEADRFQHLSYREAVFQTEARAVLGEYNKNSSNPVRAMWESLSELSFSRHTYGHTTMGYLADIQSMPREYDYSRSFFRRFYTPDNCTVIVAGDVTHERVLELVRSEYGRWRGRRDNPAIRPEPEQTAARSRALAWEGTSPPRMLIGYRIPAFSLASSDSVALEVVHALAFSESSELYQRLVVREQKLLSLESWRGDFHRDPQLFTVEARLAPNVSFDEVEAAVQDELGRVAQGAYSAERIAEVVSNLRYSLPLELQTPSQAAESVARFMALTGEVDTLSRYHARLGEVTAADVTRVASQFLTPVRRNTVTLREAASAPADAVRVGPGASAVGRRAPAPASNARPAAPARQAPARPAAPAAGGGRR